jgi:hypothetical protein
LIIIKLLRALADTFLSLGPVAQNLKAAYGNTKSDFSNLADSNVRPDAKTATGQQLTTYHSFFYNLLTWKHPRATLISFAANVALIFLARYFPLTKWLFKYSALIFGTTVIAELAGKPFGSTGLATRFRPAKYYTLSREAVDGFFDELHELLNFFVLEFQRVLFVENIILTATATLTAAIAYGLIKIVPLWGLALIGTTSIYLAPLVYIKNQELIDGHLEHATNVVNTQAAQVRDLTAQHTARATDVAKGYASDLSTKASDLIGQARGQTIDSAPAAPKTEPVTYPAVPKTEPSVPVSKPVAAI